MGRIRAALTLGLALGLLSLTAPAWGHAAYKSSEPPNGGRVSSPPSRITAEFTEPLAGGSYLRVTDPCGERVDNGDVQISGFNMSVTMDGASMGRYVVFFQAHSQLDPHVTRGEFSFSATSGARCASAGGGDQSVDEGSERSGSEDGSTAPADQGREGTSSSEGTRADSAAGGEESSRDGRDAGGARADSRDADLRRGEQGARVPNLAAASREEAEKPPVWDGIELEPFLTGLLLAAIIGAAGGKIYAGIMGPRA